MAGMGLALQPSHPEGLAVLIVPDCSRRLVSSRARYPANPFPLGTFRSSADGKSRGRRWVRRVVAVQTDSQRVPDLKLGGMGE